MACTLRNVTSAQRDFAAAVTRRLEEIGRSQQWLGQEVARIEGREKRYGQGTIGDWLRRGPATPAQAIAIERALDVTPGSLTRLLGFLPVDTVPALSVPAAIDADPNLTDQAKRALLSAYREFQT